MYKQNYIILSLILIALLVISTQHIYTHTWGWRPFIDHDNGTEFLEATETKITCNIKNDQIFSKKDFYYSDGYFHSSSGWYPSLKKPAEISISGKAHGLGFAQVLFYGNVDNDKFGDVKDLSSQIDIGSTFVFISNDAHDADVSITKRVPYTTSNGEHQWDGSGSIYYTPLYFKYRVGLPALVSGTWEKGTTWSSSGSGGGSWEIIDKDATLNYPKYISGYFENNTSIAAYGTYAAKVVEINPIKEVKWSIKKPGGEWEEDEPDKVKGGKTSSWSYTVDSTSGTYEVKAEVHFETNATTYTSEFTVGN